MTWQEGVAVAVVLAGLCAGAFLVAQRPAFWIEFGGRLFKAFLPYLITYITRRLPHEKEAEMRACLRRGGEWDPIRKRCKK